MMTVIIIIHGIVCALLITIILIQRGRGGGLAESFSGVESMFGTKTSAFLTRATTVLSIMFFVTCLSLAVFSARQSRSLLRDLKIPAQAPAAAQPPQAASVAGEQTAPQPVVADTAAGQLPATETHDSMFRKPAQAKVSKEPPKANK